jgi:regulator of protease activity HflC (stomatin/prohibitin superfamily)
MDFDRRDRRWRQWSGVMLGGFALLLVGLPILGFVLYRTFLVEVPTGYMAVLTKRTGKDLENSQEIAPDKSYKGVQPEVLGDGRYFYNPYAWDWVVIKQITIPANKLGVLIRLYGDDLGYGEIVARDEKHKGVVTGVLVPGRYPLNAKVLNDEQLDDNRFDDSYAYHIELYEPVVVPAGYKGVVTNLSGPMPQDPNVLLVPEGSRGVQEKTLDAGTHVEYSNPYVHRVELIDCRSQRFNLSDDGEMGFPSKDGFWVRLDGAIEFRVKPEQASKVFVEYNDAENDVPAERRETANPDQRRGVKSLPYDYTMGNMGKTGSAGSTLHLQRGSAEIREEIIKKIILPNARSFCRLQGSNHSGKDFISGDTREQFQEDFEKALEKTCEAQGIEIVQVSISRINPPQKIADPVRKRQIAVQTEKQYARQLLQQESEQKLAVEKELVKQKRALVEAEQAVVKKVTEAQRQQEVSVIEANQRLKVAEFEQQAAEDQAAAILARGEGQAEVIQFDNQAEAAGWKKAVAAFSGDGDEYARWVMLKKLAPSFRRMMVNTADSPLMEIFRSYEMSKEGAAKKVTTE